jgi:hypothetical protein
MNGDIVTNIYRKYVDFTIRSASMRAYYLSLAWVTPILLIHLTG